MTKEMTGQPTSEYMKQLEAGELPEQVASIQDRMATVNEDEVRTAIQEGQTGTSITSAATMTFVNEATGERIPLTLPVTMTPVRPKKVAIIGFTEHRMLAPYNDPEWDIWALNELYNYIPRWTRWFELHIRDKVKATPRDPAHLEKLKGLGCPVYMHDQYPDIPNSVRYPLEAMIQMFGSYFTNSISYMLALAIAEGYTEIGVYGVNMAHATEYCVGPETRVLTADLRWVPAANLQVGQEVVGFDESPPVSVGGDEPAQFRKYRKATIEAVQRLTRPCYRLHMADGTVLVCSAEHRWLTRGMHLRNWMETERLHDKETYPQRSSKIVKLMETWEEDHSWDAGYVAGAFDGEGHCSQQFRDNCVSTNLAVGFSQRPNAMNDQVRECLARLGFRLGGSTSTDDCIKGTILGGRAEVLRFLGTVRPTRLLERFDANKIGCLNSIDEVRVLKKEFIGEQMVIGLKTTTGTFVAEGFASHNSHQRSSCEYFLGIAVGRGIKLTLPLESDLLKAKFLYGYQEEERNAYNAKLMERKAIMVQKVQELDQQAAQLQTQLQALHDSKQQHIGALQDTDFHLQTWDVPMLKPPGG